MSPPARATALPADPKMVGARAGADPLASRAARRERRAFEQIYERHHQELYRYCLSILRRREDAEDALQATMAAALRALPGEQREVSLRPWLYRIAHNESISLLRQRRPVHGADEVVDAVAPAADERIADRDRLRRLVADLRSLPERQSSAIVMRELSGLSYEEIAAALSSSEAAARQTVYEARVALRKLEEGREMECEEVRRTISDRDGRRLRGRKIRSHIETCDGCHGFAASIQQRKSDLGALCPPIPALAATTMLSGLLGGGAGVTAGGGAVATGGVAGAGIAGSVAAKGASVLAAVVLAAGAAEVGGVIDLPLPAGLGGGERGSDGGSSGAAGSQAVEAGARGGGAHGHSAPAAAGHAHGGARHGQHSDPPGVAGGSPVRGTDAAGHTGLTPGQSAGAPGSSGIGTPGQPGSSSVSEAPGKPGGSSAEPVPAPGTGGSSSGQSETAPEPAETSPGNSGSAPGHTGTSPGNSELAPGHTGATGGNSASAPGHSGTSPGNSGSAPGQTGTAPGNSGSAPGQSGTSPGNSGSAPGQTGEAPGHSGGHGVVGDVIDQITHGAGS